MMMLQKKLWLLVCLMMALAGCGGTTTGTQRGGTFPSDSPRAAKSAASVEGESRASTSASEPVFAETAGSGGRTAPPALPSAAHDERSVSSADSASPSARRDPSPESRPGLGTEWGEARASRVHDVTFVREAGRPFAIATMHYNDRRGVEALASREPRRDSRRIIDAGGGAVSVSIRDQNGEPLEAVRAGDRTLVVGQAGQRYSIVLTNHTGHRFEAVATVDGLDVVNGKPGTFDNRGYVLLPFATLEIEGFRQSANSVAAFRFASVSESYAAQVGSARNVGVIGVAFFAERGDAFIPESELRLRESASPFPSDPRFAQPPRR
jgi:hypothetical protein